VRLNAQVYPLDAARRAAARQSHGLALNDAGQLTVLAADDCWQALREFTEDLLAVTMQTE
jgi:hypothetical protein